MAILLEELKDFNLITKAFSCFRLIDPKQQNVVSEHLITSHISYPGEFDYNLFRDEYEECVSLNVTVHKIKMHHNSLWLYVILPTQIKETTYILECATNITGGLSSIQQVRNLVSSDYNLSYTDELTGVFNRRYINFALPNAISHCAKRKVPLSIIFADLDFFKGINDFHGHAAGDHLLTQFALVLQNSVRHGNDWVARYGGDEFIVCLVDTDMDEAKTIAERMRRSAEKMNLRYRDNELKITCSLGVYTVDDFQVTPTYQFILDEVDKRLYEAKCQGRNRVQ